MTATAPAPVVADRRPKDDQFEKGWEHARNLLRVHFGVTIEKAIREAQISADPLFHTGVASALEYAMRSLDAPREGSSWVVLIHDFPALTCSTQELAQQWVAFLGTIVYESDMDIVELRHDPAIPALPRTERIYSAFVNRDDDGELAVVVCNEQRHISKDNLWFSVNPSPTGGWWVAGIYAPTDEAARSIALRSVAHWIEANQEATSE